MNIGDTVWYEDLAAPFGFLSARLVSKDDKNCCLLTERCAYNGAPKVQHVFFVPTITVRDREPPEQVEWKKEWERIHGAPFQAKSLQKL